MDDPRPLDSEDPPLSDHTEVGRLRVSEREAAARERDRRRSTWWCRTNRKLFRRFGRYMLGVLMTAAGGLALGVLSFLWFAILTPRRVSALELGHDAVLKRLDKHEAMVSWSAKSATWLVHIKCGELQGNSQAFQASALMCGEATQRTRELYPSPEVPRQ